MEGSALTASTLMHTRPLFSTSTSPSHSSSSSTSSGTPSPVPSSPFSGTLSPSYTQTNNYGNYVPDNSVLYNLLHSLDSSVGSSESPDNSHTSHTINFSPNSDVYKVNEEYRATDEALINAHISNLLGTHAHSTTSPSSTTSTTTTSTTTAVTSPPLSIWNDPNFSKTLEQNIDPASPLTSSTITTTTTTTTTMPSSPNLADGPTSEDILARLMSMDASTVGGCDDDGTCNLPLCFCNKVATPGKVHIVCSNSSRSSVESKTPLSGKDSLHLVVESLVREVQNLKREMRSDDAGGPKIGKSSGVTSGPAVAVWDMVEQRLLECNDTFAALFCVDPAQPVYLTEIAQCPAYFLRLCATNKTSWHEKRRYSLKRPEGDINLIIAIDINGTCVVTTVWKAQ